MIKHCNSVFLLETKLSLKAKRLEPLTDDCTRGNDCAVGFVPNHGAQAIACALSLVRDFRSLDLRLKVFVRK